MDTTEGGALVEDNRSFGVGERQGSQPRMRGAKQTLQPFPGIAQPLERPNFTRLGVSEPRNDLSIKVWEQYDLFRDLDFQHDGDETLEDPAILPKDDIEDFDILDDHINIATLIKRSNSAAGYAMVDDIDETRAMELGVDGKKLRDLNH
ncbi:hypothetical protein R1flu_010839 [Riccia fluitans]|uniref:Uncharacterized protein n=1 Tax=Riccia fluitans TaxID=41844 RepID=A0ABD1Z980_9MARC